MRLAAFSRKELVAAVRKTLPATRELYLDLGGCIIRVGCNSEAMLAALEDYFMEFLCPVADPAIFITVHEDPALEHEYRFTVKEPDPGKTKVKEEWLDLSDGRLVHKRLTSMLFVFGQGENVAIGPCLANSNQIINFVNNRFIEWKLNSGGLLGHAAGVFHKGRGLSLAGFSGAGKSTLALHIMSLGAMFVSNDRVMVERDGDGVTMFGVAKQPRINPGTALHNPHLKGIVEPENRERFLNLPQEELWQLEHKYDALIHECFGPGRFRLKSPMQALVILNWKGSEPASGMEVALVDPKERTDLLPAFMKSTGLFYLPGREDRLQDPVAEEYVALLSHADMIEFSGGIDFHQAAAICMHYMETGSLP